MFMKMKEFGPGEACISGASLESINAKGSRNYAKYMNKEVIIFLQNHIWQIFTDKQARP